MRGLGLWLVQWTVEDSDGEHAFETNGSTTVRHPSVGGFDDERSLTRRPVGLS